MAGAHRSTDLYREAQELLDQARRLRPPRDTLRCLAAAWNKAVLAKQLDRTSLGIQSLLGQLTDELDDRGAGLIDEVDAEYQQAIITKPDPAAQREIAATAVREFDALLLSLETAQGAHPPAKLTAKLQRLCDDWKDQSGLAGRHATRTRDTHAKPLAGTQASADHAHPGPDRRGQAGEYARCVEALLLGQIESPAEYERAAALRAGLDAAEIMTIHATVLRNQIDRLLSDGLLTDAEASRLGWMYHSLERLGWAPGQKPMPNHGDGDNQSTVRIPGTDLK